MRDPMRNPIAVVVVALLLCCCIGAVAVASSGNAEPKSSAASCFPASKWDAPTPRPCARVVTIAEDGSARIVQWIGSGVRVVCTLPNPAEALTPGRCKRVR